jgi:hypothetical protein
MAVSKSRFELDAAMLRVSRKDTWDPIRDTTPIIQVSGVTFGVLVPAASAWRSVDDLLGFAAAHPDELFARHGLTYIHVPYKGSAEQMVAVASGQVMAGVNSNGFAPFVDSGRLRLLATFGAVRTRRWPHVPTLSELGQGFVAMSPYGLVGPRRAASGGAHAARRVQGGPVRPRAHRRAGQVRPGDRVPGQRGLRAQHARSLCRGAACRRAAGPRAWAGVKTRNRLQQPLPLRELAEFEK